MEQQATAGNNPSRNLYTAAIQQLDYESQLEALATRSHFRKQNKLDKPGKITNEKIKHTKAESIDA